MLLIDGVRYNLWTPSSEEEFERVVVEHAQDIFGEKSIYFGIKQRLQSDAGTVKIPDGCAIILEKPFNWHIVEAELSSHTRDHYVSQLSGFISAVSSPVTQKRMLKVIDDQIEANGFLKLKLSEATKTIQSHRFLDEVISGQPVLTIIIEKDTPVLREVIKTLNYPQDKIKVVEFQTFTREGAEAVHAHLFERLCKVAAESYGRAKVEVDSGLQVSKKSGKDTVETTIEITIKNWQLKWRRITVPAKYRGIFPASNTRITIETTDVGAVQTTFEPRLLRFYFAEFYRAHPELKAGDKVRITVIELMKRYRLEIVK